MRFEASERMVNRKKENPLYRTKVKRVKKAILQFYVNLSVLLCQFRFLTFLAL
jgi:hypothetical protein